MYKHILSQAGNINWMALFALLTFFILFVLTIVLIFKKNKNYIQKMANMPLDDDKSVNIEIIKTNEK